MFNSSKHRETNRSWRSTEKDRPWARAKVSNIAYSRWREPRAEMRNFLLFFYPDNRLLKHEMRNSDEVH